MREELPATEAEWRERLTPDQYAVLREAATEPAFSGEHNATKAAGTFICAGCGEELFASDAKFESGCGWPSFDRPISEAAVTEKLDRSHGMVRTEVLCATCGGHLGHVFPDGPQETTGNRFCINSLAIGFEPAADE